MNGQNDEGLFDIDSHGPGGASGMEEAVRATLERHAASVPLQDPPVALLLKRGSHRRRMREILTVAGALTLVFAAVVIANTAGTGAPGGPGGKGSGAPVTVGAANATAGPSGSVGRYQATVPKDWKPGAKSPLSTYGYVPSWVQTTDAAAELGTEKEKGHHINLGVDPEPTMCLSLGSDPIVWPEGFYAEGTPLVVFDSKGRPVYVADEGFTGVDGPARLGYGDGVRPLPGLDMTHCPAEVTAGLEPYALAMIFKDTPKQ